MADPDQRPPANHRRLATALRDQVAVRRTIGDQVISLAHLRGRPVRDDAGTRVGRVSDIVVRQISVRGRKRRRRRAVPHARVGTRRRQTLTSTAAIARLSRRCTSR
jgi:PRC-barrel domain protein